MNEQDERLKATLRQAAVETAEQVVRRRLDFLVVWLDTTPDDGDLFGVHIRETWQAFRRKPDNMKVRVSE